MKTTLTLLFALILGSSVTLVSAQFELSFVPSTSETNAKVTGYSAWWQATNDPDANHWTWINSCVAGQTNILFDFTNIPNAVWLTATASDGTNQSYNATAIFFDTNNFPVAPAQPVPIRPAPPGFLFLRRIN